ncbi:MAG: hypothetical protein Q8R92_16705 [Deltaproteobacteria bacterium]|nr:hypothetical protein [Deltaproteobacteria bacterium]
MPETRRGFPKVEHLPHWKRRLALGAALALLIACGKPLTGSGYLGAYADMKANRYLEAESHLPWLRIDRDAVLLIQPVQAYFYRGRRPVAFPRLAQAFQEALAREIGKTQLFARVEEGSSLMIPAYADWGLHAVLTEVDLGLPESNLEPGVSYRGARRIGVEGKISDLRGERTLFKFKDARVAPPPRGLNPTEAEVEAELVRDLNAIARGVADTMRQIHAESNQVKPPEAPPPADATPAP